MIDNILVTGSTGKTGRRVVDLLRQRGITARSATRSPTNSSQVRFDWSDTGSFAAALKGVRAVYMVAPTGDDDPLMVMKPFIDQALKAKVERLVLLSSSMLEEGGPLMGSVHAYLKNVAPSWTVLRPSWFMQNFSEHQHIETIRREGRIYSATENGRVPFIDAADIAEVAVEALTDPYFSNGDFILTGPTTLSYDDIARLISAVSMRPVLHHRLSAEEMVDRFTAIGIPSEFARVLSQMDTAIAAGAEDRLTQNFNAITNRSPTNFSSFVQNNARSWSAGH